MLKNLDQLWIIILRKWVKIFVILLMAYDHKQTVYHWTFKDWPCWSTSVSTHHGLPVTFFDMHWHCMTENKEITSKFTFNLIILFTETSIWNAGLVEKKSKEKCINNGYLSPDVQENVTIFIYIFWLAFPSVRNPAIMTGFVLKYYFMCRLCTLFRLIH